ncbi:MAG: hypothetical protein G01um10148_329 [Parcubacteria group bacterium Gr01-1014_8]|nr:MAG: hypothetical protein G01um10148_329 [Parcubacteria group bacterium Gr01-1014_8]
MKEYLHSHALALGLAIVVGIVTVMPMILAPISLGADYKGIHYLPLNDEDIYLARIHEILDGHYSVTSPFLYDYKDAAMLWPPINEWLYALPAFLFGLSAVVVASKFLLPAGLFFLIYLLSRKLLGEEDKLAEVCAIAAGLVATLGIVFVDYTYMAWFFAGKEHAPVMWTRLVNPITGGVELFAFVTLLWFIWERKRPYAFVAAGFLLALMIGYYFAFGMGLATLGVLFFIALLRKEFAVAREFAYVGVISLLLDAWIWYNVLFSIGGEEGKALAMRNGMFFTHELVLNKALFLATTFVALCYLYTYVYKNNKQFLRSWLFIFALLGASWLAFNQQVITGRQIWYHHFVQYTVPLSMLSVIAASYFTLRFSMPRLLRFGMLGIIVVSLAYGVSCIGSYVRDIPLWFAGDQRYGDLMAWLNENAPEDCVVLDVQNEEFLARAIPAYTACNTYFSAVTYAGIPEERLVHNFLLRMVLDGTHKTQALEYLRMHSEDVRADFYPDWNAMFGHDATPWIEGRMQALESEYQTFAEVPLKEQMQKYRVDYVISTEELTPKLIGSLNATKLDSAGVYRIYTLEK